MIRKSTENASQFDTERAKCVAGLAVLLGRRVIKLRKFEAGNAKSKAPVQADWNLRPGLTTDEISSAVDQGHSLGTVVEAGEVVIDVDVATAERPNKQGATSLERIKAELGVDLLNLGAPVVQSPTGGLHIFLKTPTDVALASHLEGYPDIDVKLPGSQVVLAGSRHWSGAGCYEYLVDDFGQEVPLPNCLLAKLARRCDSDGNDTAAGVLSLESLKLALGHLDPCDYQDRLAFLKLTAAVKHATAGDPEAFDLFDDWATSDPLFAGATDGNRQIWDSLKLSKNSGRVATVGSLLQELRERGQGAVADEIEGDINRANAANDFEPVAVEEQTEAEATDDEPLEFEDAAEMVVSPAEQRKPLVEGVLRQNEILNLIAGAKVGKTWLAIDFAIRFSLGLDWMGFKTTGGKVLYIDCELMKDTFKFRFDKVRQSTGSNRKPDVTVVRLRSRPDIRCIKSLERKLLKAGNKYDLVIIDPLYRLLGRFEENSNSDITQLYDHVSNIADKLGAAVVCVHHTSKGDQSLKANVDVGSGASAMGRAADVHMSIRPHEESGKFVLSCDARSYTGFEPITIRKEEGLWLRDDAVAILGDPAKQKQREDAEKRNFRDSVELSVAVKRATIAGAGKLSVSALVKLFAEHTGRSIKDDRMETLCSMLVADGQIARVEPDTKRAKYAYCATESLLEIGDPNAERCGEAVERVRQLLAESAI